VVLMETREDGDATSRWGTGADGAEGELLVCVSIPLLFYFLVKKEA